ncbi:nose resistant to fluoxetine protein 6-like isoform X1 [Zophobas morio]|uniref:nose resistant to fluoxetine protein 6-like isoform X1 n=1 Tax=Zophobas morio TaxID=2755281 RepID=UPI003083B513
MSLKFVTIFVVQLSLFVLTTADYDLMPDLFHLDDYDKCLYYSSHKDPTYCSLIVQLLPENCGNMSEDINRAWNTIQKVSSDNRKYRHDLLRHGVCASTLCSQYNGTIYNCLSNHYEIKYRNLALVGKVNYIRCEMQNSNYKSTSTDVVISVLAGLYILFVLSVSVWLQLNKNKSKGDKTKVRTSTTTFSDQKFLAIFSFCDNMNYIFTTEHNNQDYMLFLQAMRFITSFCIISGHVMGFSMMTPVLNPYELEKDIEKTYYLFFPQGKMLVSIFFVISSWLLSVQFFKKLKNDGQIRFRYVLQSIIKRYIRFTSGLTVIILHTSWLNHLFRGPYAEPILGTEYNVCRKKWWTNLLYINNFVISDGACLMHTWYLSVDFQLTVLGLFLLWLTQKQPKYLLLTSGFVIAFQIIFMFVYLAMNNFKFAMIVTAEMAHYFKITFLKEWQATWTSTYSNLAPFAFGLCFGYLYIRYEKHKYAKIYVNLWRILTILLILGTPLLSAYFMTTTMYTNRWFNAAYGSIDKILFDLGIALFIFGLSQNLGGIVKMCFEWAPMHTLGQLSFGAYLIHFSILEIDASLRRTPHYFSVFLVVCENVKILAISYMLSVIFTGFVLLPMARLSKMLATCKEANKQLKVVSKNKGKLW